MRRRTALPSPIAPSWAVCLRCRVLALDILPALWSGCRVARWILLWISRPRLCCVFVRCRAYRQRAGRAHSFLNILAVEGGCCGYRVDFGVETACCRGAAAPRLHRPRCPSLYALVGWRFPRRARSRSTFGFGHYVSGIISQSILW